jgi:hypothetical protein
MIEIIKNIMSNPYVFMVATALTLCGLYVLIIKLMFGKKITHASTPDIICGGSDTNGFDKEKEKIRKKWYYRIKDII